MIKYYNICTVQTRNAKWFSMYTQLRLSALERHILLRTKFCGDIYHHHETATKVGLFPVL